MKKSVEKFLKFNGKTIYFLASDGQYWIAIKPICEALGVNYKYQHKLLKEHKIFGQLSHERGMVGADNRMRKMTALPEMFIYGWLFQIRSESPELTDYQMECCKILYNHFHGVIVGRQELLKKKYDLQKEESQLMLDIIEDDRFQKLETLKKQKKAINNQLAVNDSSFVKSQVELWDN